MARIAAVPHRTYAEPFVGMGGIFFRRATRPRAEVINDRNGEVANLFRILQRHYPQFMDTLRYQITSRREFERLKASDPATLTDLERAGRFLYLQRTAFGGKVRGQTFGVDPRAGAGFNLTRLAPLLEEAHERLAGVVIEQLDWSVFIDRYDRPETLFYLDPPYHGSEDDYGKGLFGRDQFAALAERLGSSRAASSCRSTICRRSAACSRLRHGGAGVDLHGRRRCRPAGAGVDCFKRNRRAVVNSAAPPINLQVSVSRS